MRGNATNSTAHSNEDRWPDVLPGLNVDEGVTRMGGDRVLYGDMLKEYCTSFTGFSTQIRNLIAGGDFVSARREAHTLKGAAGTVAAGELYAVSLQLEHACRDEDGKKALALLPLVEKEMDQVLSSAAKITPLMEAMGSSTTGVGDAPKEKHDPDDLIALFIGLRASITASDPVASERYMDKIGAGELPKYLKVNMDLLRRRIDHYDFDGAGKIIGSILKKLTK